LGEGVVVSVVVGKTDVLRVSLVVVVAVEGKSGVGGGCGFVVDDGL